MHWITDTALHFQSKSEGWNFQVEMSNIRPSEHDAKSWGKKNKKQNTWLTATKWRLFGKCTHG